MSVIKQSRMDSQDKMTQEESENADFQQIHDLYSILYMLEVRKYEICCQFVIRSL